MRRRETSAGPTHTALMALVKLETTDRLERVPLAKPKRSSPAPRKNARRLQQLAAHLEHTPSHRRRALVKLSPVHESTDTAEPGEFPRPKMNTSKTLMTGRETGAEDDEPSKDERVSPAFSQR